MRNIRATTRNKSNPTSSVTVIILLFVIIYYCGFRIHSLFKTNMDYSDGLSMLDQNETDDLKKPLKFVVRDAVCKIPRIYAFAPEIDEIHTPLVSCATELQRTKPLVSKMLDHVTDHYYLHINKQWKSLYLQGRAGIDCCFRDIHREGDGESADAKSKVSPCYIFRQDFVVPLDVNGVIVNCRSRDSNKLIFVDAFFFIHKRNPNTKYEKSKRIGVLMLGLDSMSQINLRRRMPRTHNYLENHNEWHEMLGYNKLDYDTFPNLMALLTGRSLRQHQGALHTYPFLWDQAKAMFMPTAFAADRTNVHVLTAETTEFTNPPTNYYLRPFMLAIENWLRMNDSFPAPKYCLGPRFAANYVLDYALEFAQSFAGHGGLGLFWVNSFRDYYMEPTMFDDAFFKYLALLKSKGVLKNYVVMLLSTNGMLRGRLNKLRSGFYEERLPFLYISLPNAWKRKHPELANALQANRNRLISPFDLHQTIKHSLALGTSVQPQFDDVADCAKCQSILKPIATNRSCSDAGIDWMWCSCEPFVTECYNTNFLMNSLLSHMNGLLSMAGLLNDTCHYISLRTLYGIYNSQRDNNYYYVKFSTSVANAEFEVALWYNSDKLTVSLDRNKVNRLDSNAVGCVRQKDELLMKFCVCVQKKVSSGTEKEAAVEGSKREVEQFNDVTNISAILT
ncbi:uncharacterized protein LOC128862762 [Anastrepha ludens]|uniref:uncharacterized protein LOC128862762 n=1 Tax=Anastrepha ludens TaxID=28586 RepID=UPI0023B18F48|nr:uncharacterized protein LOC128862762 [Anastrepha ludens]